MVEYKHEYDDIIIKHLYDDGDGFGSYCTFTSLYRAIDREYPGVSRTTVQRHLNKMVEKGILYKYDNNGPDDYRKPHLERWRKRTFYSLSGDAQWDLEDGWAHGRFLRVETNREPRRHTIPTLIHHRQ
jgi:hypothetical protein